jgi:hypothetical protein
MALLVLRRGLTATPDVRRRRSAYLCEGDDQLTIPGQSGGTRRRKHTRAGLRLYESHEQAIVAIDINRFLHGCTSPDDEEKLSEKRLRVADSRENSRLEPLARVCLFSSSHLPFRRCGIAAMPGQWL